MIVCRGTDSTDRAFLRWLKRGFGYWGLLGEDGTEADSLGEFWPTVVAAEKDDSEGSLSRSYEFVSFVFKGPSCRAWAWECSRRSEFPITGGPVNPLDLEDEEDFKSAKSWGVDASSMEAKGILSG
jgi:hypothetical protein